MTSNDYENSPDLEHLYDGPSKTQLKRESHHLVDVGEEILKLSSEDIRSLQLPDELDEAITTALKIKSRSGLKRQRLYIGKLLRSMDSEEIEARLRKIQHRHDTNTAQFKRLEKWRDSLIENDKHTCLLYTSPSPRDIHHNLVCRRLLEKSCHCDHFIHTSKSYSSSLRYLKRLREASGGLSCCLY